MLSGVTPTSTFSKVNKTWTCFQLCITYPWILIHYCTSTIVTSYAPTTTKLTSEIMDTILERTTSCMDQCLVGCFGPSTTKKTPSMTHIPILASHVREYVRL
jgi:hypothetical protein